MGLRWLQLSSQAFVDTATQERHRTKSPGRCLCPRSCPNSYPQLFEYSSCCPPWPIAVASKPVASRSMYRQRPATAGAFKSA